MRWLKLIYLKLFRMNDDPQKIAAGLGLGVFFGVMPGMGPLAALFFALVFRVNRAAALLGSILTNTWLSIPTFILAVKAGSLMTGISYRDIIRGWRGLIKDFRWEILFKLSAYDIIIPVMAGYIAVSLCIGILAYLTALVILRNKKQSL